IFELGLPDGTFDLAVCRHVLQAIPHPERVIAELARVTRRGDRKSTRLNSSHSQISYAVFCLKKKKKKCWTGSSTSWCSRSSFLPVIPRRRSLSTVRMCDRR